MGTENWLPMLLAVSMMASTVIAQEVGAPDGRLSPEFLEKAGLADFVPLDDSLGEPTEIRRKPIASQPSLAPATTLSESDTSTDVAEQTEASATDELAAKLASSRRRYADATARARAAADREEAARIQLSQATALISSSRLAVENANAELDNARRDVRLINGEVERLELQLAKAKSSITVASARAEYQRLLRSAQSTDVELKDANHDLSNAQSLLRTAEAAAKVAYDAAQQERNQFDLLKQQRDAVSLAIANEETIIEQLRESVRDVTGTPEAKDDEEILAVAAELETLAQSKLKKVAAMRADEATRTAGLKDAYRRLAGLIRVANEKMESTAETHQRVAQLTVTRETAVQARDIAAQAVQRSERELAKLEKSVDLPE